MVKCETIDAMSASSLRRITHARGDERHEGPYRELRFRYWPTLGMGLSLLLGGLLRSRCDHWLDLLRAGGFGRALILVHIVHFREIAALISRSP